MSQSANISASQLRWRCRRGMLELDLLLTAFVEMEYNSLTEQDTLLFFRVLDYQDQTLFDLLLGKTVSPDLAVAALINRIRQAIRN
ncbi:MAG: succinate dehydrogenase assembly factor 2 [Gammaproteobacteria bacterium]|nr:succinate dehydrogenase assembly factor 2 [Gammaproteobacteria bacterium]